MKLTSTLILALLGKALSSPIEADRDLTSRELSPDTPSVQTEAGDLTITVVPHAGNVSTDAAADWCYLVAYDGAGCDKNGGDSVGPGGCYPTGNRHSFFLSPSCGQYTVTTYEDPGCVGYAVSMLVSGAHCYTVDTGHNWQSIEF